MSHNGYSERDCIASNRLLWDSLAIAHKDSPYYDIEGFIHGKRMLPALDLELVGDVAGKKLLHLQCHLGLETLDWARHGADVTGIDFSSQALKIARQVARRCRLKATFILADLTSWLPGECNIFDTVYNSYGVLCWHPRLENLTRLAWRFMKPGALWHIIDYHPISYVFDDTSPRLVLEHPYFEGGGASRSECALSYAGGMLSRPRMEYTWPHSVFEIINACVKAGFRVEAFQEYPFTNWAPLHPDALTQVDGWCRLREKDGCIPLLFYLRLRK
jgi:SAM-dependent methyltransferase